MYVIGKQVKCAQNISQLLNLVNFSLAVPLEVSEFHFLKLVLEQATKPQRRSTGRDILFI